MAWLATQVVGVVNAHSTETGSGFESLYRVAGSDTQMLRKKNFMHLFKNFSLFKIISGTINHLGALISALHQNTKQSYMQMVHTSFSVPLQHYFPGYSVEKGFSKI